MRGFSSRDRANLSDGCHDCCANNNGRSHLSATNLGAYPFHRSTDHHGRCASDHYDNNHHHGSSTNHYNNDFDHHDSSTDHHYNHDHCPAAGAELHANVHSGVLIHAFQLGVETGDVSNQLGA